MSASSGKPDRSALIDVLKGVACLVIVLHHLVSYGPMVDVVRHLVPDAVTWLYNYGRFAVQVFLVVAGYVAAAGLAPQGRASFASASAHIGKRYFRLVGPYLVALTAVILAAEFARQWPHPASVPHDASMGDVIAHLLMLQDVLGIPALSAGVWYLAIDLQLFAGTVLLLAVARWAAQRSSQAAMQYLGVALVLALTAASLLWFNRQSSLDHLGIYFYGSYGLGLLTYWALHLPQAQARQFLRVAVPGILVAALWVDFRSRLVLAGLTGLVLWAGVAFASVQRTACAPLLEPLRHLGRMSYSVFLIHYPVLLVFNAVLGLSWPQSQVANVLGMLGVLVCSVGAASLIYRQVERSPLSHVRAAALLAPLLMVTVAMA